MSFPTRMFLILMILLAAASKVVALQAPPATGTPQETSTISETLPADPGTKSRTSQEVRDAFTRLLRQHPEVAWTLATDPTLISEPSFMAGYPELAEFVAANPEVRRNPHYYLAEFAGPGYSERQSSSFDHAVEALSIVSVFALVAFALAWLVRTIIEQRRWSQLSRRQSEVHNKILDRFSSSEEVLAYIKSPPGAKFLESAPIPLRTEGQNAPLARVMWSIQLGVIIAAGGLGMVLVSSRFDEEAAKALFAMGAIALSLGVGFFASAIISIFLSPRIAKWQATEPVSPEAFDDSGRVR